MSLAKQLSQIGDQDIKDIETLIKRYSLRYKIDEMREMIDELNIKEDEISLDKIIYKSGQRVSESKFCILYHDLLNVSQTPLEKIIKILGEAKQAVEEINKDDLAKKIEWVITKIKNEEVYDFNYDNYHSKSQRSSDVNLEDYESQKKLFNEYSNDIFNQNKKENLILAREYCNKRLTLQTSVSKNAFSFRKSIYSPSNNYGRGETFNKSKEERKENYGSQSNVETILESNEEHEEKHNENNLKEQEVHEETVENKDEEKKEEKRNSVSSTDQAEPMSARKGTEECDSLFVINQFDSPNFDIFDHMDSNTKFGSEYVLNEISFYIFEKYSLFYLINEHRFDMFLNKIKVGYDNLLPYHNHIHAADVLQTCNIYFLKSNLKQRIDLTDIDISGFFISAIIHDYKHPGLTNSYHINKRSDIAIKYNDISVLENFHVSMAFKIISENNSNIFCELTVEEYRVIRKRIIECVLATDMARHIKALNSLKIKVKSFNDESDIMNKLISKNNEETKFDRQQELLNFLLHCADISNPTKNEKLCRKWTTLVIQEFHNQGDLEKKEELPISYLCDRANFNLPKSQIGFISNIIFPCFSILSLLSPNLKYILASLEKNLKMWQREEENQKVQES